MAGEPTVPLEQAFAAAVRIHQSGDLPAAEAAYRALLDQVPTFAPALSNLGTLLVKQGREGEAERCYHLALAADPQFAEAHYNLGNVYRRRGDMAQAADLFAECVRHQPGHVNAHFNLGIASAGLGRLADAADSFRIVLDLDPKSDDARIRLGDVLLRTGQSAEAVTHFRAYAANRPDDPRAAYNLGLALANDNKLSEAAEHLHRALKLNPTYAEAHNALALALELLGRKDDAIHHYDEALRAKPDFADAWSNKGVNLSEQGLPTQAEACLRESLRLRPDVPIIHSNLLLLQNYSAVLTPEQIRDEHIAWGAKFAPPVPRPPALPPLDPARRLRIGYVSADFRTHTVAPFIETLLRGHDRRQFEVHAYPSIPRPDDTTEKLRTLADHWRPITGLSDAAAAELIRADRIDILIDLGGHTAGNRLLVFAHRPAALQATLFGYPNTTGLTAMDYRITDPISDPPGATENLSVETLLRLPDVPWVYTPPVEAPPVGPLPAAGRRQFTFGCLNNSAKISDDCLDAWAALLQSTPGTRLVLMAGQSQAAMKRLTDRFRKAGVLQERVQLLARMPKEQYYATYHEINIALDPFPYNGGVTSADALYMGVPVLSVAGRSYVSRQGVMQLFQTGLSEFVADSPAALIELAKMWLARRPELAALRADMRERLLASPLCDASSYVRNLEASLRAAWATSVR